MNKETISPAPWHDNGNEIVDGNGKVIGGAFSNEDGALMAAAPDLLAALQEVFVIGDRLVGDVYGYEFVTAARAAIAKATGAA